MTNITRTLFASFFLLVSLHAATWKTEVVDPGGGEFSSLRIDLYGNVHIAYFDPNNSSLKYAFWDHNLKKWFTATLDKSSGFCSMVLDRKGHPHIAYDEYDTGKLKYTYWDGSVWHRQTIQLAARNITYYTSVVIDKQDRPSISFYEYIGADTNGFAIRLRVVSWDGKAWEVRTVDPEKGSGKFNSLLINSTGQLSVAYANVKSEGTSLRYAHWDGRSWNREILEGTPNSSYGAWSVFALMDKHDVPHITYTDLRDHAVKYATRDHGKWTIQVVGTISRWAYPDRNGLALDRAGNPYVSYYDAGLGALKVAHRVNGRWVTETVEQNFSGYTSSIQIHDGTIWVSYAAENSNGLIVSHRKIADSDPTDDRAEAVQRHASAN